MVFEKIQQKAFSPRVVGAVSGGSRGEGATTPGVEQAAAVVGDGSGPEAAAAGAGRGAVGDVAEEGTERLQVGGLMTRRCGLFFLPSLYYYLAL